MIVRRGTAIVAFVVALFVILMVQILFVPLAQLLHQQLSKELDGFLVSWLMVAIDCLDHATLCLRSGDMADHSFPQTAPTDDAVNITSEPHDLRTLVMIPAQQREKT